MWSLYCSQCNKPTRKLKLAMLLSCLWVNKTRTKDNMLAKPTVPLNVVGYPPQFTCFVYLFSWSYAFLLPTWLSIDCIGSKFAPLLPIINSIVLQPCSPAIGYCHHYLQAISFPLSLHGLSSALPELFLTCLQLSLTWFRCNSSFSNWPAVCG